MRILKVKDKTLWKSKPKTIFTNPTTHLLIFLLNSINRSSVDKVRQLEYEYIRTKREKFKDQK
jgi:hypothetical protein